MKKMEELDVSYGSQDDDEGLHMMDGKAAIQESIRQHKKNMTSFQRLLMVTSSLTNNQIKEAAKVGLNSDDRVGLLREFPVNSSQPRDFLLRQLKINVDNLDRELDLMVSSIRIHQFTEKLSDDEWEILAKIMGESASRCVNGEPSGMTLTEDEKILVGTMTGL